MERTQIYNLIRKYSNIIKLLERKQTKFAGVGLNGAGVFLTIQGEIKSLQSVILDLRKILDYEKSKAHLD